MAPVKLSVREYTARSADGEPLFLLHGLLGSSINWHGIARRLAGTRTVFAPDLRNHGRSPGAGEMTYPAIADDLAMLLEAKGIPQATVIGHSMGGKAAMWLALTRPERVGSLVVADMAPASYPNGLERVIDPLLGLDLETIVDRRDADDRLAGDLPHPDLRAYLLQNLVREEGAWKWRVNLPVLKGSLRQIAGFPDPGGRQYAGGALFLYGTDSDYVTQTQLPAIRNLFPHARLRAVPGAGHWLYKDQPDAFVGAVQGFLRAGHSDTGTGEIPQRDT
jgi:esterase